MLSKNMAFGSNWLLIVQLQLLLLLPLMPQLPTEALKLTPHQSFRDFIPLSADNVSIALQDSQAWVLYFHNDSLFTEFKQLAASVRGLVRFGMLHHQELQFLQFLNFNIQEHTFRSLPFGDAKKKRQEFSDSAVFAEALDHASSSVPDDKLVFVRTKTELKQLLAKGIAAKPSKFTALFTIRDETPTLLQRVISQRTSQTYNFGLIPRAADSGVMDKVGLQGMRWPVPGLAVLAVQADGTVHSSRLNETVRPWDSVDYADVLQFLIEFNRQFRHKLPGDNRSSDLRVLRMTRVLDQESLVFDIRDSQRISASANGDKTVAPDFREEL